MSISITIGEKSWSLLEIAADPGLIGNVTGAVIGAAATLIGLFVASREVREAAHRYNGEAEWRKADFANNLVTEIHSDKNVSLIFRVLDWREGPVVIPDEFLPIFRATNDTRTVMEIQWEVFVQSLVVHRRGNEWRSPDMYVYRSCFDSYCSFIQRMSDDPRVDNMNFYQFADIKFFCQRTISPKNQSKDFDLGARRMMRAFIVAYYGVHTYRTITQFARARKVLSTKGDYVLSLATPKKKVRPWRSNVVLALRQALRMKPTAS